MSNKEMKCELDMYTNTRHLKFQLTTTCLGVKLDRTLSQHLAGLRYISSQHAMHLSANLWVHDGKQVRQHSAPLPCFAPQPTI